MNRRELLVGAAGSLTLGVRSGGAAGPERRLLYVAEPGIRNYTEFGGVGVLVFDMDQGHRFVKRIPTLPERPGKAAENVKGICACAKTGRLYVTTTERMLCIDLLSDSTLWNKQYPDGCDRMAISPDGKLIYVPTLEKDFWNVVDGRSGELITRVETRSGSHNTVYGLDGSRVYLAGLKSPLLRVADPKTHTVVKEVGPFSSVVRPFTVNGKQTLCYVNVNELLGFEIGDLNSGKVLCQVKIPGYSKGPVKRHGCPSHGVGLTPDEKEVWVCDGSNQRVHVFDNTQMPPAYLTSVRLREQPGWVTFSLDGRRAYPSTGEVIDTRTKQIVTALSDETGRQAHSEKMVEIVFADGKPVRSGDQFGVGRRR